MQTKFKLSRLAMNTGQVPGLPKTPRQWTATDVDRLARSIQETPELLDARPLIVVEHGNKFVVLGGNLRLAALKKLGWDEAPCYLLPADAPVDKLKEIVIKDNGSFGQWDYDLLANEWDDLDLAAWGTGVPDDWGKVKEPVAPVPGAGSTIPGAENLPKINGSEETAMDRIIIVYPKDKAEAIAQTMGLETFDKVVYPYEELPLLKPLAE